MEEDENSTEARSSTPRQVSPAPDTNTGSSVKPKDESEPQDGLTAQPPQPSPKPSSQALKKENIPILHPPSATVDSSFVEGASSMDHDPYQDSMTEEQHVRAHLQDSEFESSFVPPISPI